jgi:hypothetical protein
VRVVIWRQGRRLRLHLLFTCAPLGRWIRARRLDSQSAVAGAFLRSFSRASPLCSPPLFTTHLLSAFQVTHGHFLQQNAVECFYSRLPRSRVGDIKSHSLRCILSTFREWNLFLLCILCEPAFFGSTSVNEYARSWAV